ncbi:MAG TPA: hypothetical protein VKA30_03565, partial [Actinomycetota bacterium]|nr:hypothetical protein [Actinomycetota bacterium]
MLAYRPVLPLGRDAQQYVARAVTSQAGDSFHPFLYSLLLKPFIALGHLALAPLAQHLAALGMAVLLYALLRRLSVGPAVATIAAVPLLLDGYQLNIEHQVQSETFFQLFLVGACVLIAWWDRPHPLAVAGAGVLAAAASLVRFPGLALIVALIAYVAIRRMGWVRLGALVAGAAVALGVYSVWFRSQSGSVGLTNRNGFYLYGRVVSFADCIQVSVPEELQVFCPDPNRPPPAKAGLFTSGLPDVIRQDPAYNGPALRFSLIMIRAKPVSYAEAVFRDFLKYFGIARPDTREPNASHWAFQRTVTRTAQDVSGIQLRFHVRPGLAAFLTEYQRFAWTYGPALAALLLLGVAGGILGFRRRGEERPLGPECWLFTLSAVGVLLFPPVFDVYHIRYVLPALPLAAPAGALGLAAILRRRSAGREPAPTAAG